MNNFPNRFVVLDTETKERKVRGKPRTKTLTFRLGVAVKYDYPHGDYLCDKPFRFTTTGDFHGWINAMPLSAEPIVILAHNMGFDVRIIEWFRYVTNGTYTLMPPPHAPGAARYKTPLAIMESPPFIVRCWRRDGQQIILMDSYQWLQKPLETIGEWIGTPKGKMPPCSATDGEWFDYCEQDVYVLLTAVRKLWRELAGMRIPHWDYTPAGQSMSLYRMRYENKRIVRPEDPEPLWLDRHGYYGGYIDCFFVGKYDQTCYQLDVTGLYPSMMRENLFPCAILTYDHNAERDEILPDFDPRRTTAEVYCETDTLALPVKYEDGTYYCRGKVRTILCGPELEKAIQADVVRYIGRWTMYKMDDLFSKYVDYLWSRRQHAQFHKDPLADHVYKILLNALHGKFGQRTGEWIYLGKECQDDRWMTGGSVKDTIENDTYLQMLGGHVYERTLDDEDPKSFVPIAAWTASYGRVAMAELRALCGWGNVLYQATDSLIVNGNGLACLQLANVVREGELGYLRLLESYECVNIRGINNLDAGQIRIRPGVSRKSHEIATDTYAQEMWESFAEGLSQGNVCSVSISTCFHHTPPSYTHGIASDDGWTSPHRIDNWEIPPEEQKLIQRRRT